MKSIIKAPAKINLCLKVNDKRDDGYHDLSMIMQSISLFDTLTIEVSKNRRDNQDSELIDLKCNLPFLPTDERNLVYKIVKYIFEKYSITDNISIYLRKVIPTSAGLGGGSSDAASMLLFLNRYYRLNLSTAELVDIAAKFGSDIPFFINKKECVCEGRGEIISEIKSFNNYYIVIATPNIRVSTKEIFTKFDDFEISKSQVELEKEKFANCIDAIKNKNLKKLSSNVFNNLEIVTESIHPDMAVFKEKMLKMGAMSSLMSGSGPTVFGIFNSYFKALKCKIAMKKEHNEAFVYLARPI
ncbi:MAG: 4-(cytidine 5'-diphospho)-2-C-methyl-D-erythritol kinase [Lachnospiraceae bacterium]|nr:4-(cytidine 5'-diphospho)-2-C-methyl-D-erythritol kinase [Lachnospiraceae bacterium]